MPRTAYYKETYMRKDLVAMIRRKLEESHKTHEDLGNYLGVSRITVGKFLSYDENRMHEMSREQLIKVFDFLKFDDSEILKVIKK